MCSSVSTKALSSLNIKRIRLMFRLSVKLPSRTARTHAACVSLSFFNDVKQRGGFLNPPVQCIGQKSMPVPFREVPAASGQLHQECTQGCWHRRAARVPQWRGLYVVLARGVKHFVAKNCGRRNTVETLDFSSLEARGAAGGPAAGSARASAKEPAPPHCRHDCDRTSRG